MDEIDKKIIRALSGEFPLVAEPYRELSAGVGISEEEFIRRVQKMQSMGYIRKTGAVLRHPQVGFTANVLCAWEVPPERLAQVAKNMCAHASVSHCYERETLHDWPYNLYTMIHGKTRLECDKIIDELGAANELTNKKPLYTVREWKKASMRYFH